MYTYMQLAQVEQGPSVALVSGLWVGGVSGADGKRRQRQGTCHAEVLQRGLEALVHTYADARQRHDGRQAQRNATRRANRVQSCTLRRD